MFSVYNVSTLHYIYITIRKQRGRLSNCFLLLGNLASIIIDRQRGSFIQNPTICRESITTKLANCASVHKHYTYILLVLQTCFHLIPLVPRIICKYPKNTARVLKTENCINKNTTALHYINTSNTASAKLK